MSTRGAYGLSKNGVDKILYNHFDSYPKGLGKDILQFIVDNDNNKLNEIFNTIKTVDSDSVPTDEDYNKVVNTIGMKNLEKQLIGTNHTVYDKNGKDNIKTIENRTDIIDFLRSSYYNLLYIAPTEDLFSNIIDIFQDYSSFLGNSLFCEYAYILNLDTENLDFYIGGNKQPTGNKFSKYAKSDNNEYVECKLVLSVPFSIIRENKLLVLAILDFIDKELEN